MQKEEVHVLIVDDDQSLGTAMSEALTRSGFKATHVLKPDEALSTLKFHPVHAVVIDCMLPKMNGRDLAKKLREEAPPDLPLFFVSGIYKDKGFTREAIQSTGALAFITKPFEIKDFIREIETGLQHLFEAPRAPLEAMMTKDAESFKDRIYAINESDEIHAYNIPWVLSLLMFPGVNGTLNVMTADGAVMSVGFRDGHIVQVSSEDTKSYLGALMVEYGFITKPEIDDVIQKSSRGKRLGEALVDANVISPHAIEVVMADQQGLRISKAIANTNVRVNFVEYADIKANAVTDRDSFTELVNEWLDSKISADWIKSYYLPWSTHGLKKGPEYSLHHSCLSMPVLQRVPGIMHVMLEKQSLEEALAAIPDEDNFFRALHALMISRLIRFGESEGNKTNDFDAQKVRLEKLLSSLDKQNFFERLGVSPKSKEAEIKKAYSDLAKILHPDKLPQDAPEALRKLAQSTFDKIQAAYDVLSNQMQKDKYVAELEGRRADALFQAEQLADQARPLLSKGDVRRARELLEESVRIAQEPSSEIRLLLMWAKLKSPNVEKDRVMIQSIRDDLGKIPPEDRHHTTFLFVKGLMAKVTGDLDGAKKSFENVVSMDPEFIDARRELSTLGAGGAQGKSVDLLKGDLKDVVGMLFRKKK